MATKYILDTHALVWYIEGSQRLGQQAKAIIDSPSSELVLPIIVLAEIGFLIERNRVTIPSITVLLNRLSNDPRIDIYPITLDIFKRSQTVEGLTIPELHDRFIVSTGLLWQDLGYAVAILTKDRSIVNAAVLPVIW